MQLQITQCGKHCENGVSDSLIWLAHYFISDRSNIKEL